VIEVREGKLNTKTTKMENFSESHSYYKRKFENPIIKKESWKMYNNITIVKSLAGKKNLPVFA